MINVDQIITANLEECEIGIIPSFELPIEEEKKKYCCEVTINFHMPTTNCYHLIKALPIVFFGSRKPPVKINNNQHYHIGDHVKQIVF